LPPLRLRLVVPPLRLRLVVPPLRLRLVETRTFASGVAYLGYAAER